MVNKISYIVTWAQNVSNSLYILMGDTDFFALSRRYVELNKISYIIPDILYRI